MDTETELLNALKALVEGGPKSHARELIARVEAAKKTPHKPACRTAAGWFTCVCGKDRGHEWQCPSRRGLPCTCGKDSAT